MIFGRVHLFAPTWGEFVTVDAIMDTGADVCGVPLHLAALFGIKAGETSTHLWQVRDPLTLHEARIRLDSEGESHEVDAALIDIPSDYRRPATPAQHCTRPDEEHLLTRRIIVGQNFLSLLPSDARRRLLEPTT